MSENTEYDMPIAHADWLKGIVQLPPDLREKALEKFQSEFGRYGLTRMFSEFIGLANSVASNMRIWLEDAAIIHADHRPYSSEKFNTPSIFGALNGITLAHQAAGNFKKPPCHGCAFRLGSQANQSPSTTCDADIAGLDIGQKFMCHEELDANFEPTKVCVGYAAAIQKAKVGR